MHYRPTALAQVAGRRRRRVASRASLRGQRASDLVPDLFADLVGAGEERLRHDEAECLRGLQVDHQLEFFGLLTGNSAGLAPWRIFPA